MRRAIPRLESLESRQLLSAGDPDWSFGDHGSVNVDFDLDGPAVIPLDGGNMLLAGRLIKKLDATGAVDATFAQGGTLFPTGTAPEGQSVTVRDLKVMPDGRFVVVTGGTVSRYNADGTLDASFGENGSRAVASLAEPLLDVYRVAVRPDGRLIVEGSKTSELFSISGLTADGDTDATFAPFTFRKVTAPPHFGALTVQSDGKILFSTDGDWEGRIFKMMRFNGDGTFDLSFADDGIYPIGVEINSIGPVHDFALDDQQRIVTIEQLPGHVMAVRRLLPNGSVDTTFGGAAADDQHRTRLTFSNAWGEVRLELDGSGRILAQDDYRLARLTPDGVFDPTFGRVTTAGNIEMQGLVPRDDGSLYVAGHGSEIEGDPPVGASGRVYRLRADNTPSAIAADASGTLSIVGTEDPDRVDVFTVGFQPPFTEVIALVVKKAVEDRGSFGRSFGLADLSLISVSTAGGDDLIRLDLAEGGSRPATVSAGDGNDQIIGSPDADSLSGNAGHDRIDGRGGDDRLDGNGGRDKLRGESGNDRLFGGAGGDWLNGGDGEDILFGGIGDDYLDGGPGADRVMGSDGNDVFVSHDGSIDDLYGGGGIDVLSDGNDDDDDLLTDMETS